MLTQFSQSFVSENQDKNPFNWVERYEIGLISIYRVTPNSVLLPVVEPSLGKEEGGFIIKKSLPGEYPSRYRYPSRLSRSQTPTHNYNPALLEFPLAPTIQALGLLVNFSKWAKQPYNDGEKIKPRPIEVDRGMFNPSLYQRQGSRSGESIGWKLDDSPHKGIVAHAK